VTVGEAILSPLFPMAAPRLGIPVAAAGVAFGVLTGATAAGNLVGGWLLGRIPLKAAALAGLTLSTSGAVAAAAAADPTTFVLAQGLLGLGAGVFFPTGLSAAGRLAAAGRRGLVLGVHGIAFSAGLAVAAATVAVAGPERWKAPFVVCAALTTLAALTVTSLSLPPPAEDLRDGRRRLGTALVVAAVAAIGQFGVVALLPTFAVQMWGWTEVAAASLLLAARVVSVGAKAGAGAAVDRIGAVATARVLAGVLTVTGLAWVLTPAPAVAGVLAVAFAVAIGGIFPVANAIAVEEFGDRGGLLGTYRAAQLGVAAVAVWLMGSGIDVVGFRPVLALGVLTAVAVFALRRSPPG
jgi:NNP family nitrate/nitrite transporter-like MFS transporter